MIANLMPPARKRGSAKPGLALAEATLVTERHFHFNAIGGAQLNPTGAKQNRQATNNLELLVE